MTDLTSYADIFRAGGYDYRGYLGTPPQTVVFSRAINQVTFSEQLTAITFDDAYGGAGTYTDVREDMTILVYDGNSSRLKGRLRVAAGGASSTVLQVNEISSAALHLANNDRFDVVEEFRIWDKLVEASTSFRKDSRITYLAQTKDYQPVANGGGMIAVMLQPDQTELTADFDWTTSYPLDPANTSGLGYSVDIKDGTITVGTSTSSTCTATFPPGYRTVELNVEDLDNGATTTIQIPVDVYHPTLRPALVADIDGLRFDEQQLGWACDAIRLPEASQNALAALPDGAPVWYFEDERYAGESVSYGSDAPAAGRGQVKFVGYLVRDTFQLTPGADEVTFEAIGPLGILEQTAALPQLLINDATPANWQEAKSLTVNRFLWYLWYWHASAAAIFDCLWVDGYDLADAPYSRLATEDTSSLAAQLREFARAIRCELTCDRLGRFRIIRDPNFMTAAERAARTVLYDLTTADLTELEETHEHRKRVKLVVYEAITSGATTAAQQAVYSLAPGPAPGEGMSVETVTGEIVTDQTMANVAAGDHYARLNGLYYDESTKQLLPVPQGARWQLPDGYDWLDPAARRFVTLTLDAASNRRGVGYTTAQRWLVRAVEIGYSLETDPVTGLEARGKVIEWTVSHETHGKQGTADFRPTPEEISIPMPDFDVDITVPGIGIYEPIVPVGPILEVGTGRIGLVLSDGTIVRTSRFSVRAASGGPDWSGGAIAGFSGTALQWCVDAKDPAAGWIPANGGIYYVGGINGASPSAALQQSLPASSYRNIDFNYTLPGLIGKFGIVSSGYSGGVKITATSDGATWGTELLVGSASQPAFGRLSGLRISALVAGRAWVGSFDGSSVEPVYHTDDYGASWTKLVNVYDDDGYAAGMLLPVNDEGLMYYGYSNYYTADAYLNTNNLFRGSLPDVGRADITPIVNGIRYGPDKYRGRSTLALSSGNKNRLLLCGVNTAGTSRGVFLLTNAATAANPASVSFATLVTPSGACPYTRGVLLDPDGSEAILFGLNGAVAHWDAVNGVDSRVGNLSTSAEVIGVFGW